MTARTKTILVTGASGFVGKALCNTLSMSGHRVRRALRESTPAMAADDVIVGDLRSLPSWSAALEGVDAVIHLAARTHVIRDSAANPLAEYRRINVDATRALAVAAISARVRRFIYLSSIKVNGECTSQCPYTEQDIPQPEDSYGLTKWEAEQALAAVAAGSQMDTVILRPPLIYGPGVKANFLTLMRMVERGVPLPLASVRNRRSLLYVGNLVDAITLCLDHPQAAGKTYLVADDQGISTPQLVSSIADALRKKPRLLPCPRALLRLGAAILGKSAAAARVLDSLQVDSGRIRGELGWTPRWNLAQGMKQTAEWYYRRSDSYTYNP